MAKNWMDLVAEVTRVNMTPAEIREQRKSFAYGNAHIENTMVTREMVEEADRVYEEKKSINEPRA